MYVGVLLSTLLSSAQQQQVYNQFFMNPYIYNPAYAGVDGHPVLFVMYKQQWFKISDGPQLMHASYHAPLKGGIGIGSTVFQDSQGPLSTTSFKASGSYLVNIDRKHFLRLGMSLGLGSNTLTLPEDAKDDPAFQGEGSMFLVGDFGVSYHFDHFNVGFALPNLFSSEVITEKSLSPFKVSPTDNMLFKMNYRGHINHKIAIEPHVVYRFSNVIPSQYEFTTIVHLKHIVWLGGTYRQYQGLVGMVGVKFNNKFALGAAFELGSQDFGDLTGSSFEIHFGMHLGSRKDHERSHIAHHKSFLRTHSDELREENRLKKEREDQLAIEELQKSRNPGATRDTEAIDTTNPTNNTGSDPNTPQEWNPLPVPISRTNATGEIETGQRLERTNVAGEKEIIMGFAPPRRGGAAWALAPGASQLLERVRPDGTKEVGVKWVRINENGTLEQSIKWEPVVDVAGAAAIAADGGAVVKNDPYPIDSTEIPPTTTPTQEVTYEELASSDKHLVVIRGGHSLELPVGNHVIGGVFDDFDIATKESDKLFSRGMRDIKVGYVSARGHYYLVVGSFSNVAQAQHEKGRIKSNYNLKDVWVLKIIKQ